MAETIVEKILAKKSKRKRVSPDEIIWADVDLALTHDALGGPCYSIFKREFPHQRVWNRKRIVCVADHFVPPKDIESAIMYRRLKQFVEEQKIPYFYSLEGGGDCGICHVILPYCGHVKPGEVILGTDSHTTTHGALGAFATGVGITDMANVFRTGKIWLRVPHTIRFNLGGKLKTGVMAKDIILKIISNLGCDGANYKVMEFSGSVIKDLCVDERFTLTNMAVEAGAKAGIIEPDGKVKEFIQRATGGQKVIREIDWEDLRSDKDANYIEVKDYNLFELEPLVALPHSPENVTEARRLKSVKIDQAYIGSCTGAKYYDLIKAAEVLEGRRIAKSVRLFVAPATLGIYKRLEKEGYMKIFLDSGARILSPGCGACLGTHLGVLGPGEVCISTTNRNFRGRMGSPESFVYLASPQTVASSAIKGYISPLT